MHPLNGIALVFLLVIQSLLLKNPLAVLGAIGILVLAFFNLNQGKVAVLKVKQIWPIALSIALINPIFGGQGQTVLLGVFGKAITLEAVIYGLSMAGKLILVVLCVALLSQISDADDLYSFFYRRFRQIALTFSMSANAVNAIRDDYQRVQMVMKTRGLKWNKGSFSKRIFAVGRLARVVLISVLEGTFDRGEALYVRGQSENSLTCYKPLTWSKKDKFILGTSLFLAAFLGVSVFQGEYNFIFYPHLEWRNFNWILLLFLFTVRVLVFGRKGKKLYGKIQS